jgi:3-deoxy-manno-octulosonate cytidylyltransferase (CMP-KDO synthetase)
MHPVILIPARMASTRLPNKPLAMIGDAPMIVHVWRRAVAAKLGDVVVACDGKDIADAIERAGGRAVITDPDLPSGSDRIYAALSQIDPYKKYDVVINLQGDMPTMNPDIIRKAAALLDNPAVDIGTLAAPIDNDRDKNDAAVVKVGISLPRRGRVGEGAGLGDAHYSPEQECPPPSHPPTGGGTATSFSRTASGAPPYYHHIGIYAYRRAALEKFVSLPPSPLELGEKLEQLRAMEAGMRIDVAIVDHAPIGVDTPETLEIARKLHEQKK